MNTCTKVLVLMAFSGVASAGDLVLKLGNAGSYRYHRIPVTGNVTLSPATGDVTVDPVADAGTSNDGWCPAGGSQSGAPTFTTPLGASTSSLPVGGGSVTLSWAASGASSGCTASTAGVTGWNGNSVASPVTVDLAASGTYNFSVTCANTNGQTTSGPVTVTVATPGDTVPPECNTRTPPAGISRQNTMTNYNLGGTLNQQNSEFPLNSSVDLTHYSPLFGTTFNQNNQVARVFLDANKYVAMAFPTSGVPVNTIGGISWAQASQAMFTVQISICPGDFGSVIDPLCKASAVETGGIAWKVGTKPATNPGFYCYLTPGQTYYINAIATDDGAWTTTTCSTAWCDWFVNHVGGW